MAFKIGRRYSWGEPGSRQEFKGLCQQNEKFVALMDGFWPFTVQTMNDAGYVTSVTRKDGMVISPVVVGTERVLFSASETKFFRDHDEPFPLDEAEVEAECAEESTLEAVLSLHIGKITASNAQEAIDLIKRTFNVR